MHYILYYIYMHISELMPPKYMRIHASNTVYPRVFFRLVLTCINRLLVEFSQVCRVLIFGFLCKQIKSFVLAKNYAKYWFDCFFFCWFTIWKEAITAITAMIIVTYNNKNDEIYKSDDNQLWHTTTKDFD